MNGEQRIIEIDGKPTYFWDGGRLFASVKVFSKFVGNDILKIMMYSDATLKMPDKKDGGPYISTSALMEYFGPEEKSLIQQHITRIKETYGLREI